MAAVITLFVVYVVRGIRAANEQNIPFLTEVDNIKSNITHAHLWLEELIAGDASLNFEQDVEAPLASASAALQSFYNGKNPEFSSYRPLEEVETRVILKEAIISLESLTLSARNRWETKITSTIPATDSTAAVVRSHPGDEQDQQFDADFASFISIINRLSTHIEDNLAAQSAYWTLTSWLSVLLVAIGLGGLGFWVVRLQLRNRAIEWEHNVRTESQNKAVTSLSTFIEAISAGNYSVELNLEEGEESLATTLISMRDKLRQNAEEDKKRNWTTTGLAQIGDILRISTRTTNELFDNIIKFVVNYTKSNQGGLFLLNDENESEKFLELVACYAFERKKFLNKKVDIGEGLVGQCFVEGERIYLLEVPTEYITITSGLGGAAPGALLLVPLKVNEKLFGVLELASFSPYEEHEIELVEKLSESIAATISSVRVSESTRILLEKTQQQAEEMRAQEEEMRQNMEELEATQEEMRRKEKHIQNMLDGEKSRNEVSQRNRQVVMELTKTKIIQEGNWEASLEKITSTIARQLGITRCSIWDYRPREHKIRCEKLYSQATGSFESGLELAARDYPGYFEAVSREEVIIAKDAFTHVATKEFSVGYLDELGIQSRLDVPYFSEAKIAGIICCEHQGEQKDWTDEDVEFLKSCADLIAVTYNTSKINLMLEQLSDDQETMQTIIDNIPRAVFWKDKELRFQGCNKIFANVAGLKSHRDLIGKTDYEMPWKEHGDAYRKDDAEVMNSRKARLDLEERNVNSEGVESWVLTSKVPVMNKHGDVVAVLGMFEDITDRKLKEAQMEANLKELVQLRKQLKKQNN
jgi:PAS domain S-box-containing protein